MAQDFNSFLQGILGRSVLPQVSTPPVPVPTPVPVPQPVAPPVQAAPVQMPQSPAMDPRMFALFQQAQQMQAAPPPRQGPTPVAPVAPSVSSPATTPPIAPPAVDYGGTWESVQWQNNGTTYNILMPQANTQNLPEGAVLIPNGTITDEPERVQRAVAAGEQGQQGSTFIGTLAQMPAEIQGVFRSSDDVYNVSEGRPIEDSVPVDDAGLPVRFDQIQGPVAPTSQVPDAEGKTVYDRMDEMWREDQKEARFKREGAEQFVINERSRKPLTTEQLRQTNEVAAGQLEAAGIFEVPVDRMVIRDANGKVSPVPITDPANLPEGTEIITYGGTTPPPQTDKWTPMDALSAVNTALEVPKRKAQSGLSQIVNRVGDVEVNDNPVLNFITDVAGNVEGAASAIPGVQWLQDTAQGGLENVPGATGFVTWLLRNSDEADAVREGGYVDPESGQRFEGERAVWERFQSDRNLAQRAADDIFTDPLNALTTVGAPIRGAARGIGRLAGREVAEEATQQAVSRGIGVADESLDAVRRSGNVIEDLVNAPNVASEPAVIRRGVGIADESVRPAVRLTDDAARTAADFANAPNVVSQPPVIRRGVGAVDESVPVAPVLRGGLTAPASRGIGQRVAGVAEDVLNAAADVVDIPERVLGAAVDAGVGGIRGAARGIGRVPVGGGRQISDAFNTTVETLRRDRAEEATNALGDLVGQESVSTSPLTGVSPETTGPQVPVAALPEPPVNRPYQEFENGDVATRDRDGSWTRRNNVGEEVVSGTWNDVSPRAARTEAEVPRVPDTQVADAAAPSTTPGQPPLAPVTRAVDDVVVPAEPTQAPLGSAAQPVTEAPASTLATDRPITDLGRADPRDEVVSSWPDYTRPQSASARAAGEGRVGENFDMRPQDVARALADEQPDKWTKFVKEMNQNLAKPDGYAALETARREAVELAEQVKDSNAPWRRFVNRTESGAAQGRAYEVLLEARHLVEDIVPAYRKQYKNDVPLPAYSWKRWGGGADQHTALDTLAKSPDGQYVGGTPLEEATELAMFHPNPSVRTAALIDIEARLGIVENGLPKRFGIGKDSTAIPNGSLPNELKEVGGPGEKNIFSKIQEYGNAYRRMDAQDKRGSMQRRTVKDIIDLSRQADSTMLSNATTRPQEPLRLDEPIPDAQVSSVVDEGERIYNEDLARSLDEQGSEVFERDLAASALRDVGETPSPLALPDALPLRDTEPIELGGVGSSGVVVPDNPAPLLNPNPAEVTDRAVAIRNLVASRGTPEARLAAPMDIESGPLTRRGKILNPLDGPIGRLADRQNARATERTAPTSRVPSRMSRSELDSFYVRGRVVSETQMQTLGQKFTNGESLVGRWDRLTVENLTKMGDGALVNEAEQAAAAQTVREWTVDNLTEKELVRYNSELTKAAKKKPDQERLTQVEQQIRALEALDRDGTKTVFGRKWDSVMSALREVFLYNVLTGPRYIQTQALGNSVTLILTKHYGVMDEVISPRALKRAIDTAVRKGEAPKSIMREVADQYGLGGKRQITTGGNAVRDQTGGTTSDQMRINRGGLLGVLSTPFANKTIRDVAATFDVTPREGLWADIMDRNMLVPRNTLYERMVASLPASTNRQQFDEVWDALPQRFSTSDIRREFGPIDQRWADRNARDWQEALSKTDKVARDEVKRVFFDGGEKNIDLALKRVFFFHYWMSRATPLYTEALLRDPVFLYQFANMTEAMQNDDDLSGSKFLKWMETPMGYNILIRPDAFFATFASLWEDAGYTPDGENKLGWALRNSPLMVNPIMQSITNMLGMQGDAFLPDPVGANKFIQVGQAAIDNMNVQFGWDLPPARNPQEDLLQWARSNTTELLDWVPGVNHVAQKDAMAYKENEVRSIIAEIALGRDLDLDDPIVQQSMTDPSSEMYQEAMKRYARQDALDITLRILPVTAVLYPKSQLASPKDRTLAITGERESAEQQGVGSTQRGQELYTERDLIYAADEGSRTIQIQEDAYKQLGTPEERGALQFYYGIQFGSAETPVTVSGKTYTPEQLQAMDDASRETLAATWAEETGNTERIESARTQRAEYRDAHPEYAAKADWANEANDYEGGPVKWWQDTIVANPNAARYYNSLTPEQQADPQALTSVEAYLNWKGDRVNYYDPNPISVNDPTKVPYNPSATTGGDSSGSTGGSDNQEKGPTVENISTSIREYQNDVVAYNQVLSQHFGQEVNIDQVNPMAQQAIISNMERDYGVRPPSMSGYAQDYLEWAAAQQGGNASVAAYVDWYKKANPTKAGEATEPTAEEIQALIADGQ